MREARRARAAGPGDGDALAAVARTALSVQHGDTRDAGDAIMPFEWPSSGDSEADAGAADPGWWMKQGRGTGRVPRGSSENELGKEAT